jgi:3-hydroxymyristoyl/3-hydroxydecanoyl-(acyl carrier protein) dehydratase
MFEFIHSIDVDSANARAEGVATVPAEHPLFGDHFPGMPLLPGSMLIELTAQIAGPLAEELVAHRVGIERWAILGMIREAKFLQPIRLPATVHIAVDAGRTEAARVIARVTARVKRQDVLRAELWMMMHDAEPEWTDAIAARRARVAKWKAKP